MEKELKHVILEKAGVKGMKWKQHKKDPMGILQQKLDERSKEVASYPTWEAFHESQKGNKFKDFIGRNETIGDAEHHKRVSRYIFEAARKKFNKSYELEKARSHKYIRRLGAPKQYHYIYQEGPKSHVPYDNVVREFGFRGDREMNRAYPKYDWYNRGESERIKVNKETGQWKHTQFIYDKPYTETGTGHKELQRTLESLHFPEGKTFKMEGRSDIDRAIKQLKEAGIKSRVAQHPKTGLWHGIDKVMKTPATDGFKTRKEAENAWYEYEAHTRLAMADAKRELKDWDFKTGHDMDVKTFKEIDKPENKMFEYVNWLRTKGIEYSRITPEQDERYLKKFEAEGAGKTFKMEPGVTEENRGNLFKVKYKRGDKTVSMTVRAVNEEHAKQLVGERKGPESIIGAEPSAMAGESTTPYGKPSIEELSNKLKELEGQGKKGTPEWIDTRDDWVDAQNEVSEPSTPYGEIKELKTTKYGKILTDVKYQDDDGVEKEVFIEHRKAIYPYEHEYLKVWAEPTKKGRNTEAYRKIKADLGDDWSTDITDSWYELDTPDNRGNIIKIGKVLDQAKEQFGFGTENMKTFKMEGGEVPEPYGIMPYDPGLKIVNTEQLPRGLGARYLEVMKGKGNDLIAVRWRKIPIYDEGHMLIDMKARR